MSIDSLFLIISNITIIFIIIYSLANGRKTPIVRSYILFFVLISLWASLICFQRFADYLGYNSVGSFLEYLQYWVNLFIPVSYLTFCLFYTESSIKIRNYLILFFLSYIGFFSFILLTKWNSKEFLLTLEKNNIHVGFYYIIYLLFSGFQFLLGTILIFIQLICKNGIERKRSLVIITIIGSTVFVYGFSIFFTVVFDINTAFMAPLIVLISSISFFIALFRYGFRDIVPIARKNIVNSLDESLMVVDNFNKIIDYNRSLIINFLCGQKPDSVSDINQFISIIEKIIEPTKDAQELFEVMLDINKNIYQTEISTFSPSKKYYKVNIHPVLKNSWDFIKLDCCREKSWNRILNIFLDIKRGSKCIGRVITFQDITAYKVLTYNLAQKNSNINTMNEDLRVMNEELSAMNEELTSANIQLKIYSQTIEELTLLNERNRIARDVHDTLGHTLTILIMLLKASKIKCSSEMTDLNESLEDALNVAQEGMKELRGSIEGLSSLTNKKHDIIYILENMVKDSKSFGIQIELSIFGEENYKALCHRGSLVYLNQTIFKICKEALTNSLKHGKSTVINIIIKFNKYKIKIFINDNGLGCKNIIKGYGLSGMEDRLKKLNGAIMFGSDGEKGFNINITIPTDGDKIYD